MTFPFILPRAAPFIAVPVSLPAARMKLIAPPAHRPAKANTNPTIDPQQFRGLVNSCEAVAEFVLKRLLFQMIGDVSDDHSLFEK